MTRKNHTKIGYTLDGIPAYWGKKDSEDSQSRNLTLWVDIRGDYFRVPPLSESLYIEGKLAGTEWDKHVAGMLSKFRLAGIKKSWVKAW